MKKTLLTALSIAILFSVGSSVFAKNVANADLTNAIKMYKAGNYSQCYTMVETAISKDPSNPLGYYYKAMTAAQLGKKDEAIENYERAITLAPKRSNLIQYAEKGKRCLETPENCHEAAFDDSMDEFIRKKNSDMFSEEAREMFEKLKIEQMMRNMNQNDDIDPQKFREYRDFSSMNNQNIPSNDEIADAVRTLQKAGLINFGSNSYSDLSVLMGQNHLLGNSSDLSNIDPRLLQSFITNTTFGL